MFTKCMHLKKVMTKLFVKARKGRVGNPKSGFLGGWMDV